MKYIEINIETESQGIEAVVSELMNLGITNTVVEDPRDIEDLMDKKQTYDWDYLDDEIIEKIDELRELAPVHNHGHALALWACR